MGLQDLLNQRYSIHMQLVKQLREDTDLLATKAETMAECATNIKGQGYSSFMTARDDFIKYLNDFRENYSIVCSPFEKYHRT